MSLRSVLVVSTRRRWWLSLAGLACVLLLLVGAVKVGKSGKKTHLGVPPSVILNLQSSALPADDAPGQFFYDTPMSGKLFAVPDGFSFMLTDVFVEPAVVDPTDKYAVALDLAETGTRTLAFQFAGGDTHHYPLASGVIIPGGITPDVRNLGSTKACVVKLLGYLVKGDGLAGGESPVPP